MTDAPPRTRRSGSGSTMAAAAATADMHDADDVVLEATPQAHRRALLRLLDDMARSLAQLSRAVQYVHDPTRAACPPSRTPPFPCASHEPARVALLAASTRVRRSRGDCLAARAAALPTATPPQTHTSNTQRSAADTTLGYSAYWRLFGNLPTLYEAHAQLVLLLCSCVDAMSASCGDSDGGGDGGGAAAAETTAPLAVVADFFCSAAMQLYVAEHVMYTSLYATHGAQVVLQLAHATRARAAAAASTAPRRTRGHHDEQRHAYAPFLDVVARLRAADVCATTCTLPVHAGAARGYYQRNASLRSLHAVLLLLATPLPLLLRCVQCARGILAAHDGGTGGVDDASTSATAARRIHDEFVCVAMRQMADAHTAALECANVHDAQALVRRLDDAYVLDTDTRQRHRDVKAALSAYVMRQLHAIQANSSTTTATTAAAAAAQQQQQPPPLTDAAALAMTSSSSRVLLHYGRLYKRFRRGTHERLVFLFTDCCCHVEELTHGGLRVRGALPLGAVTRLVSVVGGGAATAGGEHAFELHTCTSVVFTFYADTAAQKQQWLDALRYALRRWRKARGNNAGTQQQHAATHAQADAAPLAAASRLQRQRRRDELLQRHLADATATAAAAATEHDDTEHEAAARVVQVLRAPDDDDDDDARNATTTDAAAATATADAAAHDAHTASAQQHTQQRSGSGSSHSRGSGDAMARADTAVAASDATAADVAALWSAVRSSTALRHIRTASGMSLPQRRPHSSQHSTPRSAVALARSRATTPRTRPASTHDDGAPAAHATPPQTPARDAAVAATAAQDENSGAALRASADDAPPTGSSAADNERDDTSARDDDSGDSIDEADARVAKAAAPACRVASLLSTQTTPSDAAAGGDTASDSDDDGNAAAAGQGDGSEGRRAEADSTPRAHADDTPQTKHDDTTASAHNNAATPTNALYSEASTSLTHADADPHT